MKTDHSAMKLGKHPPRRDPRTLQLANYIGHGLPPPPARVDYASKIAAWPMLRNDQIGDCTVAAAGHMIQQWTTLNGKPKMLSDEIIVAAYSAISGYKPSDPGTDQGIPVLNVLKHWRKTGIGGDKIAGFVALEPRNHTHIKDAVYLFANCHVGFALPLSAQRQDVWSVPPGGATGAGAANSWGGHVVAVVGYDDRFLTVVTWGKLLRVTWQFWDTYCDESFAVLSHDWVDRAKGTTPGGFNWQQLQADLDAVR
jgi:hypothetical protein